MTLDDTSLTNKKSLNAVIEIFKYILVNSYGIPYDEIGDEYRCIGEQLEAERRGLTQ
jgi:hypothetical protein